MSEEHPPSVSPGALKKLLGALYVLCAASVIAELVIHKDAHFGFEAWPAFHAAYGFVAFLIVVFGGALLRKLIMRDEAYYGEGRDGD